MLNWILDKLLPLVDYDEVEDLRATNNRLVNENFGLWQEKAVLESKYNALSKELAAEVKKNQALNVSLEKQDPINSDNIVTTLAKQLLVELLTEEDHTDEFINKVIFNSCCYNYCVHDLIYELNFNQNPWAETFVEAFIAKLKHIIEAQLKLHKDKEPNYICKYEYCTNSSKI